MTTKPTVTYFGRNSTELDDLEQLLKEAELPKHDALVIGAGLYPLFCNYGVKPGSEWWQRRYSWEYLEVAAILMRLEKPWTVTVIDASRKVHEAVQRQKTVVIDDFKVKTEYAKKFLSTFGVNGNDEIKMEAVNNGLQAKNVKNRLTVFKVLDIPESVRKHITVVHGNVENSPEIIRNRRFGIVTMFNTSRYVTDNSSMAYTLDEVVAEGGILAADFKIEGWNVERRFGKEIQNYGNCGGHFGRTYRITLLSRKPLASDMKTTA